MSTSGHRSHVADIAAGCVESNLTSSDLRGDLLVADLVRGDLHGRGEEPHEVGEGIHVVDHLLRLREVVIDRVLRRRASSAALPGVRLSLLAALIREQLVGDPLLDVVGLAGEDHKRLVLGLPTVARYCPVVAISIGDAVDTKLLGPLVLQDGVILDGLDEAESEEWSWDTKPQVC